MTFIREFSQHGGKQGEFHNKRLLRSAKTAAAESGR